jgi:aminopeptidase
VQPGWQVLVYSGALARPLIEEVSRALARRDAYALLRLSLDGETLNVPWAEEAPTELLDRPASIRVHELENADALLAILAPENTRQLAAISSERLTLLQTAYRPAMERMFSGEMPTVACQYPTPALAQEAGMSLRAFEDFLYGACLLDWDAERERMSRHLARFDGAEAVRIVGAETDLTISLAGRRGEIDAGGANVPGGEFFYSPVEDSAEGTIAFVEYPAVRAGREVTCIRLRFEAGRVIDGSAQRNEEFLLETLDSDEGARRLGELGVGCNPGITRHMKKHALRREDRGDRASRARKRPPRGWWHERQPDPLGHRQGPARRRQHRARRRARPGERRLADLTRSGDAKIGDCRRRDGLR